MAPQSIGSTDLQESHPTPSPGNRITPDSDGIQHVTCPDLPQLSVQDGSLNGALARAEEAIAAILAGRDKP